MRTRRHVGKSEVCRPSGQLRAMLAALALAIGCALLAPSVSLAAFTRPFVRQIQAGGPIALDTAGDLWTQGEEVNKLDEFEPAGTGNAQISTRALEVPAEIERRAGLESIAMEGATGNLYALSQITADGGTGRDGVLEVFDPSGKFLEAWENNPSDPLFYGFGASGVDGGPRVAIDNSSDPLDPSSCTATPSGCTVYIAAPNSSDGIFIQKRDSHGEPTDFVNAKGEPVQLPYVRGSKIVGTPLEEFDDSFRPGDVTVDPEGNIYATVHQGSGGPGLPESQVAEYRPSGEFVRAFTGEELPGLAETPGWSGNTFITGVAVDPTNSHLLVSFEHFSTSGVIKIEAGAVAEFDLATGRYLNQITEGQSGVPLHSAEGVAVDPQGFLYVVNEGKVEVLGEGHYLPTLTLGASTQREPTSAVLNGAVDPESASNPEKQGLSECQFEYVAEGAYKESGFASASKAACAPPAAEIPADSAFHSVNASLTGLQPGATYRYRLVASTGGSAGGQATSAALAFTTPAAPRIASISVANVSSTFGDLQARIEPAGAPTSYHFEYDTRPYVGEDAHGTSVPLPDASIGAGGPTGGAAEAVLQHIAGLLPATVYHYRVVASNEFGVTDSAEASFATLSAPASGLPDGRAYELVTPANKEGGSDMFATPMTNHEYRNSVDVGIPSESGDAFLMTLAHSDFGPFPGNEDSSYLFSRTVDGWVYKSLAQPSLGVQDPKPAVWSPTLSMVGLEDLSGSVASAEGRRSLNLLGTAGGPYTTLHAGAPTHALSGGTEPEVHIVGASRDMRRVILEGRNDPTLCPGAERQPHGAVLCEWDGAYESVGGEQVPKLTLANASNEGVPVSKCGAVLGEAPAQGKARDAVSDDGSRIVFTAPDPTAYNQGAGCWNLGTTAAPQVYLRSRGQTIELSLPEAGVHDPTGQHPAEYVGAAADDSRIFFLTQTELTKEAEELGLHDNELYEYDVQTAKLARISAGLPGSPGATAGAEVKTVTAISADGTAVYFDAFGALAPGASTLERTSAEGSINLYRYSAESARIEYVAAISTVDDDSSDPEAVSCSEFGGILLSTSLCPEKEWYTTPDGRYLLFASSRDLTGYDTTTAGGTTCYQSGTQGGINGHCEELYRYDAANNSLTCVSCDPSGAPPVSNALFNRSLTLAVPAASPVRAMSNDGSEVFFDTADPLVPRDTNGTLDIYEWHEGRLSLISSGSDPAPSFFLGMSADGSNVFIGTHARLVPQDTDTGGDIYDARVCTAASPCLRPSAGATAQCEGDACQTPQSAPIDATPGSLGFAGAGNLTGEVTKAKPKSKPRSTGAGSLARALRECRTKHGARRRRRCEASARARHIQKTRRTSRARAGAEKGRKGR
ncbi:MAG: hypothetical protein ACTHM1_02815 [Solirubrobacteraceae bacterium]